jgi:hypothetical protein
MVPGAGFCYQKVFFFGMSMSIKFLKMKTYIVCLQSRIPPPPNSHTLTFSVAGSTTESMVDL